MTSINVLKYLIIAGMQSRQWDSTVFNDAEVVGNWGNQIESKQCTVYNYESDAYHTETTSPSS